MLVGFSNGGIRTCQPISSATSTFGTVLTSTFLFDGGIIAQNNSVCKAGFSG